MTPEERRAFLLAPITIRTIGGRGWSGRSFDHLGLGIKSRSRSVYYNSDERSSTIYEESLNADHLQS